MSVLGIGQFRVNLIGNNIKVICNDKIHQRFQITFLHNRTGWVVWERKYQNLCLRCDCSFQLFSGQTKLIFCFQFNDNRLTACQLCTWKVRYVTRLWNQYLVTRIEHGTHCDINRFASSDSDHNLIIVIVFQTIFPFQKISDFNF